MAELLATLEGPSFISRTALDSYKNLAVTKKAIETSFRYQIAGKGFSLVEILSPCPVDWDLSPREALQWIREHMIPVFPLGTFRDNVRESQ
jgi:2-oxoglutarate ferredoxin oxidoreductase subunit beta